MPSKRSKSETQWDQTLEEVHVCLDLGTGVPVKQIQCCIQTHHMRVATNSGMTYFDAELASNIVTDDSTWYIEDGNKFHAVLQKAHPGETWSSLEKSGETCLSKDQLEDTRRTILLERFEKENPGFDFSQAKFNGQAADARSFLGGMATV